MKIGDSLYDAKSDNEELVTSLMNKAKEKNVKVLFPTDFITASNFSQVPATIGYATDKEGIPDGLRGLDCGQASCQLFHDEIVNSKTIVWNGPPGVFEFEEHFSKGTKSILSSIIEATEKGATSIIGGGDTATVVTKWANGGKISHVSTEGGASLELMEGKTLPDVPSLSSKS